MIIKKNKSNEIKISRSLRNTIWNNRFGSNSKNDFCYCCIQTPINIFNFSCGHLINIKNGGTTYEYNLIPICNNCNRSMGDKDMIEFMEFIGIDNNYPHIFLTRLCVNDNIYKYVNKVLESSQYIEKIPEHEFDKWSDHNGMLQFDFNAGTIFNENNNFIINLFSKFFNNKKIIVNSCKDLLSIVIISNDVYEQYDKNVWNNDSNYDYLPCKIMDFKKENSNRIIEDLLKRISKIDNNTDNADNYYLHFKSGISTKVE